MIDAMHAAVLKAPREFDIADRAVPQPRDGEVVVHVAATAVCHTDLSIYTGAHPGIHYPVVMGHEATGRVAALGDGVAHLKIGQPVIINPIISCGRCDSCLRGDEHLCRNAGLFGREVDGSMSEFVCLASRYVFPLPERLPLPNATL